MRNLIKLILEEIKDQKIYDYMTSYVKDVLKDSDFRYLDSYIIIWDNSVVDHNENGSLIEYDVYDGKLWISKKCNIVFYLLFQLIKKY